MSNSTAFSSNKFNISKTCTSEFYFSIENVSILKQYDKLNDNLFNDLLSLRKKRKKYIMYQQNGKLWIIEEEEKKILTLNSK